MSEELPLWLSLGLTVMFFVNLIEFPLLLWRAQ